MAKTELDSRDYEFALAGLGLCFFYLWWFVGFLMGFFISLALFVGVLKSRRLLLLLYLITPLLFSVAACVLIVMFWAVSEPDVRSYPLLTRQVIISLIFIAPTSILYWLFWNDVKIAWIELRQR